MLKETDLRRIAKLLKLDEEAFVAAAKAEAESDITLSDKLSVFDETELKTLKDNEYKSGKEKGLEIAIKDFKAEIGIDFAGKTLKGLADAVAKKALDDAKIAPDDRVEALKKDLDKVRIEYRKLEETAASKDALVTKANNEALLYRTLPQVEGVQLPINKLIALMNTDGYQFDVQEGVPVFLKDGEVVKDNLSKPLAIKDVVTTYAKESKLYSEPQQQPPGGRGAGDRGAKPVFTKLSELHAHYIANGKSIQGTEIMNEIRQIRQDNPDFDMKS